ncbi:MAG: hypothetical protein V3R87_02820 [Dehalococcoidia bacterium]
MARYRKKPIVIEATQFLPVPDGQEGFPWPEGVYRNSDGNFRIDTLEGPLKVSPKDWVITGIKGERYPCKPDIFEATYDLETPCESEAKA